MTQAQLTDDAPHVMVRVGRDTDWPLLCSSFASIYSAQPSHYGYRVPPHIVVAKLEQLRNAPHWQLLVACPSTDDDEVMGLLLYRKPERFRQACAWITVKPMYQRKGVAKALLRVADIRQGEVDCAFLIPHVAKEAQKHGYTLRFRPYLPEVELWLELQRGIK